MSTKRLFEDFPPTDNEHWMSVVERDLKGANFDKKLVWRSPEGLDVRPFYRRQDLDDLEYLKTQVPGRHPFVRGGKTEDNRWVICQPVTRSTAAEANAVGRKAIATGAEALAFRTTASEGRLYGQRINTAEDFSSLLSGIDTKSTELHFDWGAAAPQVIAYLQNWCQKNEVEAGSLSGSVEFDPLRTLSTSGRVPRDMSAYWDRVSKYLRDAERSFPGLRLLIIHTEIYLEAGSNLAQDLALVISQAVEILNALTDRGWSPAEVLKLMGVKAGVSNSYFMEIAFFRSLRLLWATMARAYGVEGRESKAWVHAETAAVNKTVFDPQVNILRQTTETMSAAIGGVDVMSVRPWDEVCGSTAEPSERLARNTQLVIREESGLDHAVDPSAGSYYIEKLTDELASRAWSLFRDLEGEGGYLAALKSETIRRWIVESREGLDKGVASRRATLLGTNQYPNASEQMSAGLKPDLGQELSEGQLEACPGDLSSMFQLSEGVLPWSDFFACEDEEVPALPPRRRLAQVYEELRLRVEALDRRPSVYLWTFGEMAFKKARAGFCRNLYGCAGFLVQEGEGQDEVSPNLEAISELRPHWVVFCSSDAEYSERVPSLIKALRERFPQIVAVVAGYPKDAIESLREAGVQDFVYMRTPAVEYLKQCVDHVGGKR